MADRVWSFLGEGGGLEEGKTALSKGILRMTWGLSGFSGFLDSVSLVFSVSEVFLTVVGCLSSYKIWLASRASSRSLEVRWKTSRMRPVRRVRMM